MAYVLHVPIVTPCLCERVVTYFNEVYGLKKHEEAVRSTSVSCLQFYPSAYSEPCFEMR